MHGRRCVVCRDRCERPSDLGLATLSGSSQWGPSRRHSAKLRSRNGTWLFSSQAIKQSSYQSFAESRGGPNGSFPGQDKSSKFADLFGGGAYTRTTRNQAGSGIRSAATISGFFGGDARRRRPDIGRLSGISVEEQFTRIQHFRRFLPNRQQKLHLTLADCRDSTLVFAYIRHWSSICIA